MEGIIIINVYVQIVLNISLKNCKNKGLHLSHMLFWSVRVYTSFCFGTSLNMPFFSSPHFIALLSFCLFVSRQHYPNVKCSSESLSLSHTAHL